MVENSGDNDNSSGGMFSLISTYFINSILLMIIFYLIWKIFKSRSETDRVVNVTPSIPPMKKRDFTMEELKEYNGLNGDGRILIAVNGKVFDVTRGKTFYGPGGPYSVFAGKDASRGLATFSLEHVNDDLYDDLSDLKPHEMESVLEWEMQFKEKYDYIGKLLKPGESHNSYSDDDSESNTAKAKND